VNADVLDIVIATFIAAIDGGFNTLIAYGIPLLSALAIIVFYVTIAPVVISGAGAGDAIGFLFWVTMKIGVYYWLIINLPYLTNLALQTFIEWGLAPSGAFTLGDFLLPSRMIRAGWVAALPVGKLIMNMGIGKVAPWNWPTLLIYVFAWIVVMASFAVMAYEVIAAVLEYHFAVMVSPVLFPWGVLTHTGFFAELSVAWIVGGLIRMLIMAGVMGVSLTLFDLITLPDPQAFRDAGISEACVAAVLAGFFAAFSWTVPRRASSIGGRGMALALTGSDLYFPIWRAAPVAATVVQGTSSMIRAGMTRIQGRP
jgi:type IV secretion system protein TrbL